MARAIRIEFKGALYHITARGNERKAIFRDDEDYEKLTEIFEQAKTKYSLIVYCYSLMSNHYHWLVETPEANIAKTMHFIQTTYTIYFNRKYQRAGHLFQGRYKALLVDKNSYLLELSRYIHLNPLRAKIVKQLEDYRWSSFQDCIGLRKSALVDAETILKQFGEEESISQKKYREFCYQGKGVNWERYKKDIYAGVILGAKEFTQRIKERIKNQKLSKEVPSSRKLKIRKSKQRILELVCKFYEKMIDEVFRQKSEARKVAIYLLRKYTEMSLNAISELFGGIHYSGISKTVKRIEEERKINVTLDKKLHLMEAEI